MAEDTLLYRSREIRPVVQAGEYVLLYANQKYRLYQTAYVEPLPPSHALIQNLGAIAANTVVNNATTQPILDMGFGQLGQFRCRVLDDFHFTLNQPAAAVRLGTKNVTARINRFTNQFDWLTEFFVFEDQIPFLGSPTNPQPAGGLALTQARILFYGFKYALLGKVKDGKPTMASGGHLEEIVAFDSIEAARSSGRNFRELPQGGWAV